MSAEHVAHLDCFDHFLLCSVQEVMIVRRPGSHFESCDTNRLDFKYASRADLFVSFRDRQLSNVMQEEVSPNMLAAFLQQHIVALEQGCKQAKEP